ncbi:SSI family serine proteinase inhibitor [Streptomyces sp. NPDC005728]|uniref:SSI family serine proteinase inhibitor n=1 Tax=Streptomyces sp. NPDC005728 TaxID=3157054 RepID=UPI0033DD73C7
MRKIVSIAAVVIFGTVLAGAAHASLKAPAMSAAAEDGQLLLTVSGSTNTWIRGVRLNCPPASNATHPHAPEACSALAEAQGDFDALSGDPKSCSPKYDPVTASATGTYRGRRVAWHGTFGNACALDAATGPVFRF